jgi:poly(3-hydroxybutyrate) depolymerase
MGLVGGGRYSKRLALSECAAVGGVFIVRFYLPAAAVSLCIMPMSVMLAAPPATPKPTAAPTATPASSTAADSNFAAQAAARHAKRTECLKQAKEKKLVGSARDAYVKDCVGP